LVTSSEAAAYTDITHILKDRWPLAKILLVDSRVQGEDAPASLISAIEALSSTKAQIIIIARGGGSLEDLSAFNDEKVARAISISRIPTIVGVGHERDVTLSELVADLRATTPTNAAQLATPDAKQLKENLKNVPKHLLDLQSTRLATYKSELGYLVKTLASKRRNLIEHVQSMLKHLEAYSPKQVLKKGYAVVRKAEKLVKSANQLKAGDIIKTSFIDGDISSEVNNG